MLLVIGRRFRLLRWDRAGVIVTPAIDYYQHPGVLCDILLRISYLEGHELGFDSSAIRLRPTDVDFLRMDVAALHDPADISHAERKLEERETERPLAFQYVRSLFRTSLDSHWPRYRLEVPNGSGTREFLVAKPVFCANDLVGRGTRGYVALDCETGRFVWLKDAWRASYLHTETEGDFLGRLNGAGVENVPTLVCHGDIRNQTTITGDVWERQQRLPYDHQPAPSLLSTSAPCDTLPASSEGSRKRKRSEEPEDNSVLPANAVAKSDGPLRHHTHYRIAVQEVCMPLEYFQYGRQLLSIVLDCLRGKWYPRAMPILTDGTFESSSPGSHEPSNSASSSRYQRRQYPHISQSQKRQARQEPDPGVDWYPQRLGAFEAGRRQRGRVASHSGRANGMPP